MSLHTLATHMAQTGRGPDSMLVHMSPREVESLQALAKAHGGSLTINPHTGLPEAGFLDSLLPMLAGFALDAFVPGLGEAIGGAFGASAAVGTGIAVGGLDALATGSLSKGLMAGFGAYGGAGLSQSLAAAGVSQAGVDQLIKDKALEASTDVTPAVTTNAAPQLTTSTSAPLPGQAGFDAAGNVNTLSDAGRWGSEGLSASTAPTSTPWMNGPESMTGPSGAPDTPFDPSTATLRASYQGIDPRLQGIKNLTANEGWGKFAAENWKPLASAGTAALLSTPQNTVKAGGHTPQGYIRPAKYDPYTGTYTYAEPVKVGDWGTRNLSDYTHARGGLMSLANGGAVAFADGGGINPDDISAIEAAIAAAQGKSDAERNAARDQLLTKYDPATLAQAPSLSQYGGAEQYATAAEEARQRMAAAQASTPAPSTGGLDTLQQAQAAAPTSSPDANAAPQITDEQRAFIDWQSHQNDPMQQGIIADEWARQGITDPYSNATLIKNAQEQIDRANRRMALVNGTGDTNNQFPSPNPPTATQVAPWNDTSWKNYLGTNKEAFDLGTQAKTDPAAYKALKAAHGWDDATAQAWILNATDPYAAAVKSAGTPSNLVAGPGPQSPVDVSSIRRPGQAITEGEKYSQQYSPDQLTGIRDLWFQYKDDPKSMSTALNQFGFTPDDLGLALGMSKNQVQKYFSGQTVPTTGNQDTTKDLAGINAQQLNAKTAYETLNSPEVEKMFQDWATKNGVVGAVFSGGMPTSTAKDTPWITTNPLTVDQAKALDASYKKMIDDYNAAHPYTPFSLKTSKPDVPAASGTPTANASGIQTLTNANAPAPDAAASANTPAPSGIQQLTKDGHLVDPTTGHLLNPTLTAAQLSEAKGNMPEMQAAYQAYWNTVKPGDILDFAGGTLTMNPNGTATHTYTDANGKQQSYTFSKGTDFATVAKSDPNIAQEWKSMFDYNVPVTAYPAGPVLTPGTGTTGHVTQTPTGWTPPVAPPTRVPTSIEDFNNRFNTQTGDSAAVYNYLMGKTDKEPKSTTNTGPIMKPYWETVGGKTPTFTDPTKGMKDPNVKPTVAPDKGKEWTFNSVAKIWQQTPISTSGSSGPADEFVDSGSRAANGGLMGYAAGGLGSLGGYSDGGRLLKGPGDGVSDSIPASIADRQPARLADGEFVVPARIVSELGNGSTEAGARRLYQMMDRVQNARKKSVGKGKVATDSRAEQYLPA
jgi:hypothetical protein